jgi:hypothetical protein
MTGSRTNLLLALALYLLAGAPAYSECVPFSDAHRHIGKTQCVRGTIVNIKEGDKGVTFLDFCENFQTCPFTVVVFGDDLKQVGDVRQLKGRFIEINGTVQDYDGRAEIILRHPRQLGKDAHLVPPLPKNYDVERRGRFSPGRLKRPKAAKSKQKKQGRAIDIEDPSESQ